LTVNLVFCEHRGTDSLSGWEFNQWLACVFAKLGFAVEQTPYRGDFGADVIITWNGIRTAVQAKSGHSNVGVAAVQAVVAAQTTTAASVQWSSRTSTSQSTLSSLPKQTAS